MEWFDKLDELNKRGYDATDRLILPDGTPCGEAYPSWWTPEQIVTKAYEMAALLERECPNLNWQATA